MKKILIIAVFVLFATVAFGTLALAGGGQVQHNNQQMNEGSEANGDPVQTQIGDPERPQTGI